MFSFRSPCCVCHPCILSILANLLWVKISTINVGAFSSHVDILSWIWGIFHIIFSVPHNTTMSLNNVLCVSFTCFNYFYACEFRMVQFFLSTWGYPWRFLSLVGWIIWLHLPIFSGSFKELSPNSFTIHFPIKLNWEWFFLGLHYSTYDQLSILTFFHGMFT